MRTRLAALIALLFGVVSLMNVAGTPAHGIADKDCSDFDNQAQAQNFFLDHGGPDSDPHGLDEDGDRIACESNPCPCSTDQGGGGGGGAGTGGGKKKHIINVRGTEIRNTGKFVVVGKVPTFENGKGIQIQRKLKGRSFKKYKTTRTNGKGKIRRVRIDGPINTCFKVVVPARGDYRKTEKKIGCIVKARIAT